MASTESGRQMYPSFKEAHEAFVAEYTALYHGFPKYLEDLVIGFGWGEDSSGNGGSSFRLTRKAYST